MESVFSEYLSLLDALREKLKQLSELVQRETEIVRKDNLIGLDEIIRQEQAMSIVLRELEQTRIRLLEEMGLQEIPLSGLNAHYPIDLLLEARQVAEVSQGQYQTHRGCSETARNALEHNLHKIEKIIQEVGEMQMEHDRDKPMTAKNPTDVGIDYRA